MHLLRMLKLSLIIVYSGQTGPKMATRRKGIDLSKRQKRRKVLIRKVNGSREDFARHNLSKAGFPSHFFWFPEKTTRRAVGDSPYAQKFHDQLLRSFDACRLSCDQHVNAWNERRNKNTARIRVIRLVHGAFGDHE